MTDVRRTMAELVLGLRETLDADERRQVAAELDGADGGQWTYLPGPRAGLPLETMSAEQREIVDRLFDAAHSPLGAELARGAIEVERVRRELVTGEAPAGDRYWLQIQGDPGGEEPWGWRVNGHHVAVHVVVAGEAFSVTPHFLGAEPALVSTGPLAGRRLLGPEEDLARDLLEMLDPDQRRVAVVADRAPDDIHTRADPVADPTLLPDGIVRADLDAAQRLRLDALVHRYLDRAPASYADECWRAEERHGLDRITFAWAGSTEPGEGRYYCVKATEFLIEYDNTQDDANHAHSVWRHLRDDWGGDALRRHYARHHAPA